jgi:hypothetical protein
MGFRQYMETINNFRFNNSVNELTDFLQNLKTEGCDILGLINDFSYNLYEKANDNEKEDIIKLVDCLKYIAKDYYENILVEQAKA